MIDTAALGCEASCWRASSEQLRVTDALDLARRLHAQDMPSRLGEASERSVTGAATAASPMSQPPGWQFHQQLVKSKWHQTDHHKTLLPVLLAYFCWHWRAVVTAALNLALSTLRRRQRHISSPQFSFSNDLKLVAGAALPELLPPSLRFISPSKVLIRPSRTLSLLKLAR